MSARPSLPGLEANVEVILRRVGILEAAAPAAGGGIQFDTFPQAGDWLYIETDDASAAGGSPHGFGFEFRDFGGGISVTSSSGITVDSDERLILEGDTNVTIYSAAIVEVIGGEFDVGVSSPVPVIDIRGGQARILMADIGPVGAIQSSADQVLTNLPNTATAEFLIFQEGPLFDLFAVAYSGAIRMPNLPISDPGLSDGQIWNDGGTIKMST